MELLIIGLLLMLGPTLLKLLWRVASMPFRAARAVGEAGRKSYLEDLAGGAPMYLPDRAFNPAFADALRRKGYTVTEGQPRDPTAQRALSGSGPYVSITAPGRVWPGQALPTSTQGWERQLGCRAFLKGTSVPNPVFVERMEAAQQELAALPPAPRYAWPPPYLSQGVRPGPRPRPCTAG
jgi:hypothetical protein